ncbi:MAG: metallophosphoesterase [Methanothrix sp.]|nr:metallophosphoesterase [Methanothrix sp.]
MSGLTWLHISDCHQIDNKADQVQSANRQIVLRALVDDIKKRATKISSDLEKIDFIVFSGDVANSGKPHQYRISQGELFKPILEACGLDSSRLFIVPGNHDLDMDEFKTLPEDLQSPLNSEDDAHNWLADEYKRSQALAPLREFTYFVKNFTSQDPSDGTVSKASEKRIF